MNAPLYADPKNETERMANALSAGIAYVDRLANLLRCYGQCPPSCEEALGDLETWAMKAAEELPEDEDDGTSGQDRESYSDDQDREGYT